MSFTLLGFVKSFSAGRLSANSFVESYAELWRIERDGKILQNDDRLLSECLSSIFCVVDLFNPSEDREEYELTEEQLQAQIADLLGKLRPENSDRHGAQA